MYELRLAIGTDEAVIPYPYEAPPGTHFEVAITPVSGQKPKPITFKVPAEVINCVELEHQDDPPSGQEGL